jgi:aminoglycoside/choline kinase family phosphotransferase
MRSRRVRATAGVARDFDSPSALCYRPPMSAPPSHDVLARAVADAFGRGARLVATEPLHGDASSRRYVRLRLESAPVTTVTAMILGEGRFGGSDELGAGATTSELPFVNVARWLGAHGLPVPVIHADLSRRDGLLLLEDVGDVSLWTAVSRAPSSTPSRFADAVDLLVELQVAGARHPDSDCIAFGRRFDHALATAELEHFLDHGIETRVGHALPIAERAELLAELAPLAAPFAHGPTALSHRDFMAWNVHVRDDDSLVLIDFQDALVAPDAFDLAQLLTDRTTNTLVDAALEASLIARFEDGMTTAGLPVVDGFHERYRLTALQHALKVIGRFWFLEVVKGKAGYLAYLPAVYGVARHMFAGTPALAGVQRHVARHVPELAP